MGLRQEFTDAITQAEARRAKGFDAQNIRLHQVIAGEQRSGKTHFAHEYIKALADRKLVDGKTHEYFFPGKFMHDIFGTAKEAKGGILLIDDINKWPEGDFGKIMLGDIRHVMMTNECTVVLLGRHEALRDLIEGCRDLMNAPVIIAPEAETALGHPMNVRRNPFTLRPRGRKAENA